MDRQLDLLVGSRLQLGSKSRVAEDSLDLIGEGVQAREGAIRIRIEGLV